VPLNPAPARRPGLALPWARLYVVVAVTSGWLRYCLSPPDPSWGRNAFTRGSGAAQSPADRSTDFGRLEGGCDKTFRPSCCALRRSGSSGGQGCKKGRLDGYLLPITLPVTVGLGENAEGALNALVPVSASGGERRPCARGLLIRMSQFPYSTVVVLASLGRFAQRSLRVRGYGRRLVLTIARAIGGRRVRGLDLRMGPLVICVS